MRILLAFLLLFFSLTAYGQGLLAPLTTIPTVSSTGLQGQWKLTDGSGTSAVDSSGGGHPGTWHGTKTTAGDYYYGNFGVFDGATDYIDLGNAVNPTTAITVTAWALTFSKSGLGPLITKDAGPGANSWGINPFITGSANKPRGYVIVADGGTGTGVIALGSAALTDGIWHRYVTTYSTADGVVRLYIDGQLSGSGSDASKRAIQSVSTSINIGRKGDGSSCCFQGQINDVRVYSRAWSATEVLHDYQAGGFLHSFLATPYSPSSGAVISAANTALRDPSNIIKVGSTYYVYFTSIPSTEPNYPNGYGGTAYYASSSDLATWVVGSQVIGKGGVGDFDEHGAFSPGVFAEGGTYYLSYTGVSEPFVFPTTINKKSGLASSQSPTGPFTKLGVAISPGTGADWDAAPGSIDDSSWLKVGSQYRIYYSGSCSACGGGTKKIGYSYSSSPSGPYTKYTSNPVILPPSGYVGIELNSAFVNSGIYSITADGVDGTIQYWTSPNGDSWTLWPPMVTSAGQINSTAVVFAASFYVDADGIARNTLYQRDNDTGPISLGIAGVRNK